MERRWDIPDGQQPSSVLSADEVMRLIRARVHLKRSSLAAALANPLQSVVEDGEEDGYNEVDGLKQTGLSQQQLQHRQEKEREGLRGGVTAQVGSGPFWGEGDASFWDDSRPAPVQAERSVIVSEGVGGVSRPRRMEDEVPGARLHRSRRASMSIARCVWINHTCLLSPREFLGYVEPCFVSILLGELEKDIFRLFLVYFKYVHTADEWIAVVQFAYEI